MLNVIGSTNLIGETIIFDRHILVSFKYEYPLGDSVFWYAQDVVETRMLANNIEASRMNSYVEVWLHKSTGTFFELNIILLDESRVRILDGPFQMPTVPVEKGTPICDVNWA
jgi:hypothetical protein